MGDTKISEAQQLTKRPVNADAMQFAGSATSKQQPQTYSPQDSMGDLIEAAEAISKCAYPVSTEIDRRGYAWSDARLDEALPRLYDALRRVKSETSADLLAHYDRTAELLELERQVIDALPCSYYMDPPDGGNVSLGEQVRRMSEDAALWRNYIHTGELGDGAAGEWIRSAYGNPSKFTYYNMEVAFTAGWKHARAALPAALPHTHPQPAALNEVSGELGALVAKWREQAATQEINGLEAESIGLTTAAMRNDARAHVLGEAADELEATLAATGKQQVGEPEIEFQARLMDVKTDLPTERWRHSPTFDENPGRGTQYWVQYRKRYIYYAPPAQGINLGKVREFIADCAANRADVHVPNVRSERAVKLLALIDQRDAEPGVGNG